MRKYCRHLPQSVGQSVSPLQILSDWAVIPAYASTDLCKLILVEFSHLCEIRSLAPFCIDIILLQNLLSNISLYFWEIFEVFLSSSLRYFFDLCKIFPSGLSSQLQTSLIIRNQEVQI